MAGWNLQVPYWMVLASRCLEIFGLAGLMVPINVMAFGFLPKDKTTSGSGLRKVAREVRERLGQTAAEVVLSLGRSQRPSR